MTAGPSYFPLKSVQSSRRKLIYTGKTKNILASPSSDSHILYFKDEDHHPELGSVVVSGKGAINNRLSELLMSRLGDIGIDTHYIERLNMREQLVRKADPFKFQVVIHNSADAEFANRYGVDEGLKFDKPLVEYRLKSNKKGCPVLSLAHLEALDFAGEDDVDTVNDLGTRINDFLSGQFLALGYRIVNMVLEFGQISDPEYFYDSEYLLIDEISPNTMTLWDIEEERLACKPSPAMAPEALVQDYQTLASRFGILDNTTPYITSE